MLLINQAFICDSCEGEFDIEHYSSDRVKFCPFCGDQSLTNEDEEVEEEILDFDD